MSDVLVVARPGDEFALAAPLLCPETGAPPEIVFASAGPNSGGTDVDPFFSEAFWRAFIDDMKGRALRRYRRVIVPSVHGAAPNSIVCAAVAAIGLPNLWMLSSSLHEDVVAVDAARALKLLARANQTQLLHARTPAFPTVVGLRQVTSEDIVNFAAHLGLPHCPRFDWLYQVLDRDTDPWGIGVSDYERRRHDAELELLGAIDWSSLVEVGACVGVFTERLMERFPRRRVTALEPNESFVRRLHARINAPGVVVRGPISSFEGRADVFVLSSCVYEMEAFPFRVLEQADCAILTSHQRNFERDAVEPVFASRGWRKAASKEVAPAVELYCGELVVRDGSLINLWRRL